MRQTLLNTFKSHSDFDIVDLKCFKRLKMDSYSQLSNVYSLQSSQLERIDVRFDKCLISGIWSESILTKSKQCSENTSK